MSGFLPYAKQSLTDADLAAVEAVLKSDFWTTGPAVQTFETALCEALAVPHAVACANGTAALHLAAMALGLGPGDVGIVPSITFVATANALRYVGADVVFADVDPGTGLMTPDTLKEALTRAGGNAKAVFVVHLNGQSADMVGICEVAREHGLFVVEDACHAIGGSQALPNGSLAPVGSCHLSEAATFSFHPAKTVAAGEGGAIATRDPELARKMARLCTHGLERDPAEFTADEMAFDAEGAANPWYYELDSVGFNYRMPDILCALGTSQLTRLPEAIAKRAELVAAYDTALADLSNWIRPVGRQVAGVPGWHLYAVSIDFQAIGLDRATLMRRLRAESVGTQVHYIPVHRQPYYWRQAQPDLSGADAYYRGVLSLPLFEAMTRADVARVVETLARVVR